MATKTKAKLDKITVTSNETVLTELDAVLAETGWNQKTAVNVGVLAIRMLTPAQRSVVLQKFTASNAKSA